MIRRPPRSTQSRSSAASDVYKRQVDGLDEPDGADLYEIVELLAARGVATRQGAHQRQVHRDELLARRAVAVQVIAPQQILVELLGVVATPALSVGGGTAMCGGLVLIVGGQSARLTRRRRGRGLR